MSASEVRAGPGKGTAIVDRSTVASRVRVVKRARTGARAPLPKEAAR